MSWSTEKENRYLELTEDPEMLESIYYAELMQLELERDTFVVEQLTKLGL